MARTLINCPKCGGPIVLDLSGGMKLIAPSFTLTPEGVKNVVIDLRTDNTSAPMYICASCKEEYDKQSIETCTAVCALCQERKTIRELSVTSYVSPICDECVRLSRSDKPSRISDIFSAPPNFRVHPMAAILFKKFPQL